MEFIENINKEDFEAFVLNSDKAHFMQSYYWGEIQKNKKFIPYYVGVKRDNKICATALILEKKVFKNISFLYCPRGFVADYTDKQLVEYFLNKIINFTKKKKAMFFRMDPDLILNILDDNAKVKEKNEKTYELLDLFNKNSFKHNGFNKNFENNQPRYTFRLDLDRKWEDIYGGFHPTTRKILNKNNPFSLNVYKGNLKDLKDFYFTMIETSKRENLVLSKLEYYETFYKILNDNNMSDIYMVKANIVKLKKIYSEKIESLIKEKEQILNSEKKSTQKSIQKIETLEKQIQKLQKENSNLEKITDKELTLSSIITAKYKDMVWTIHGGNHTLLRELNSNYLIYEQIIKDAHSQNYKKIDFFGTTGEPNESNPVYGIYLFKKRLGGDYIEFIGEFDYINQKLLYFLYTKILPLIRKIIKKLRKN